MNIQKKDLNTLPKGMEIPQRPPRRFVERKLGKVIHVSKTDFEYIAKRNYNGFFTIPNTTAHGGNTTAYRLAAALDCDREIILSATQAKRTTKMPDGATWRTVRLVSAYKTEDGKLCVIQIEPRETKEGGAQ